MKLRVSRDLGGECGAPDSAVPTSLDRPPPPPPSGGAGTQSHCGWEGKGKEWLGMCSLCPRQGDKGRGLRAQGS